jgi:hypothetical protein
MNISKEQARNFLINYHFLNKKQKCTDENILNYIKKVGCIQFDPLNIVSKNPDLVLQARFKDYSSKILYNLLYENRKLIDGWDKNMSIFSLEDWPYFERYRKRFYEKYGEDASLKEILPKLRQTIKEKAPLSSLDVDFGKNINWFWAPAKVTRAALESMHFWGELIIHHKIGTRKVYDFAENHIPKDILIKNDPNKTLEHYHLWNVKRRIGSTGILWKRSSDAFLGILKFKGKEREKSFDTLEKNKEIVKLKIEDIKYDFYIKKEDYDYLLKINDNNSKNENISFLAPLDNIMWDRKMIKELFDFEYVWEVYKPKEQRVHGYYVLPVLYGNKFIARFEPVFEKKQKILNIKNWWWENNIKTNKKMLNSIDKSLEEFKNFLGAEKITISDETKEKLKIS